MSKLATIQYVKHPDYKGLCRITKTYRFHYTKDKRDEYVEIPSGTVCNFNIFPGWMFLFMKKSNRLNVASLVYESLVGMYQVKVPVMLDGQIVAYVEKDEALQWFNQVLKDCGYPRLGIWLLGRYLSVVTV